MSISSYLYGAYKTTTTYAYEVGAKAAEKVKNIKPEEVTEALSKVKNTAVSAFQTVATSCAPILELFAAKAPDEGEAEIIREGEEEKEGWVNVQNPDQPGAEVRKRRSYSHKED